MRKTQYYWQGKQGVLYHTYLSGGELDVVDPFFDSIEAAESYLEQEADSQQELYDDMVLYDADGNKIKEAVEVLTEQSGFSDYM